MIIKAKIESKGGQVRTVYYKHTSGGTPIYGPRSSAANFPAGQAEKVLAQLKQIDARAVNAELEGA